MGTPSPRFVVRGLFTALCLSTALAANANAQDSDELWERYDQTIAEFEEARAAADGADPMTQGGFRAYERAIDAGKDLATVIESIISTDSSITDDERTAAVDALLATRQVVGSLLVDIERCQEAVVILDLVLDHPLISGRQLIQNSAEERKRDAEICIEQERQEEEARERAAAEAAAAAAAGASGQNPAVGSTTSSGGPSATGGWILASAGLGALAGGLIWDASLGSDRDEFDRLNSLCSADGCSEDEFDQAEELADKINGAKVPIAVLVSSGSAMMLGGVIWAIVAKRSGGSSDAAALPDTRLVPIIGEGRVGFGFSGRF